MVLCLAILLPDAKISINYTMQFLQANQNDNGTKSVLLSIEVLGGDVMTKHQS